MGYAMVVLEGDVLVLGLFRDADICQSHAKYRLNRLQPEDLCLYRARSLALQ